MRRTAVTCLVIGGLLAGCATQASSPAEVAQSACTDARGVPLVGAPDQGSYEASSKTMGEWTEALTDAAEKAAAAAEADSAYGELSAEVADVRDDVVRLHTVTDEGGAVLDDEMSVISDHIAALVATCARLAPAG